MDLKITPLSDGLGAEATRVDLSKPVDGETKATAFFLPFTSENICGPDPRAIPNCKNAD